MLSSLVFQSVYRSKETLHSGHARFDRPEKCSVAQQILEAGLKIGLYNLILIKS